MNVEVLICTLDEGIFRVENLLQHEQPGVSYLVSHQYTDDRYLIVPDVLLQRKDVRIVPLSGRGLSRNRNNALKNATGEIGLIADDDVTYLPDSFQTIAEIFNNDPVLDVACFKIKTLAGEPEFKDYPTEPLLFKNSFHHYMSSIEVAFKTRSIKENDIWFDERFGIGTRQFKAGEEEIFICDCIKAGLKVMYFPYYVVNHPYFSSAKGNLMYEKQRNMLRGAVNARIHGWKAIPKAFYDTAINFFRLIANNRNPVMYLLERLFAISAVFKTNKGKSAQKHK